MLGQSPLTGLSGLMSLGTGRPNGKAEDNVRLCRRRFAPPQSAEEIDTQPQDSKAAGA
jgi:hypothetical protein